MDSEISKGQMELMTSICGICPGGCGVNVKLIDGKIERI
jgi:hypothetical protein